MRLDHYQTNRYHPGASVLWQVLWYLGGDPIFQSKVLPFSTLKVWILRVFGAKIGQGVRIKPGVKVKFPWRLTVGDYVWIGENAWLDNVAPIVIESHVCLSQGVYLCTGNHDWSVEGFDLIPGEIYLAQGSWIAAKAVIGPGVRVGTGAVLALGSVTGRSLQPHTIYAGNPAQPLKPRPLTKLRQDLQEVAEENTVMQSVELRVKLPCTDVCLQDSDLDVSSEETDAFNSLSAQGFS